MVVTHKKVRKYICLILVALMNCSLIGCGIEKQKIENNNIESTIESSSEKYIRTDISIAVNEDPLHISKSADGGLYVVTGDDKTSKSIWYLDKEDNCEKLYDLHEQLNIDKNAYCKAFVNPEGNMFVEMNQGVNIAEESPFVAGDLEYYVVDKTGNKQAVDLKLPAIEQDTEHGADSKDKMNHVEFAKNYDGYMYLTDANSNVYEINFKDNSSKCVFENNGLGYISDFCVYDRMIIMWLENQICFEGIDTHDNEKEMSDRFFDFFNEAKYSSKSILMDIDNGELCTISADKICKFNLENDKKVKYKAIGTGSNEYISSQITIDGDIYALVSTYDNPVSKLCKYSVNEKIATVSDSEPQKLKIWVLEGESNIEECIRCFTDQNPDVEVEVENGMGGFDSGITAADAIKNLNTALLAGDGPDIIYMDKLDINKYINAGELYNLTELVKELEDSGEYFNNILETFNEDGAIYAVPSSVTLIGKVGTTECLKASEDLGEFVDYIKSTNAGSNVIHKDLVTNYVLNTYYKNIQSSIKNGEADEETLKEFFEASKELYDIAGNKQRLLETFYMYDAANYAGGYDGTFSFVFGNRFDVVFDPAYYDMAKQINGEVQLPANDYKEEYLVRECIAISSRSPNTEIAKEYIRIALGKDCQSSVMGAVGFRVNKKALEEFHKFLYDSLQQIREANGVEVESDDLEFENKIKDIVSHLETVSKPIQVDWLFDQIVFDEMNSYIQGEIDLNTAVEGTIEKAKLYLSE